mmetsp:Transcript_118435/g.334855  ORF Transcript_118435/g.334855 Transcript_118435/m.334855 type:complete len:170 (-) Transcript_118435:223-732(-)
MKPLEQDDATVTLRRTTWRLWAFTGCVVLYCLRVLLGLLEIYVADPTLGALNKLTELTGLFSVAYFLLELCCLKTEQGDTPICRAYPCYSCLVTVVGSSTLSMSLLTLVASRGIIPSLLRLLRLLRLTNILFFGVLIFVCWKRWSKYRPARDARSVEAGAGYFAMPSVE